MHGALASAMLYYLHTAGPAGIYACGGGFGPRHDGVRRACTGNRSLSQSSAQESPGFSRGEWSTLSLGRLRCDCGGEVRMYAQLREHDALVGVAVELLDLAVFHVPEVGARDVERGSGRLEDACGRLERPGEGAPDRQLDRDDAPHDVHPVEFPVHVGNLLAQGDDQIAQVLTAVALLAGVEPAVAGEQSSESLHVQDVPLATVERA